MRGSEVFELIPAAVIGTPGRNAPVEYGKVRNRLRMI